jgi:membrane protease subunit HflC
MKKTFFPTLLAITLIIILNSIFVLEEGQQAVVTQFGKPVGDSIISAGLKFKIPLIQKVIKFDKRILEWDGAANEIPTNDDKYVFIDAFARWKISDPLKFYKAARNERTAQSRLDDVIDGIVRDKISNRQMVEIIRSTDRNMETYDAGDKKQSTANQEIILKGARLDIIDNILQEVSSKLEELDMGITVIDVQLKRIDYNSQVQSKLFNRMISEQNMIAEKYRAQGQGKKQEILGIQIQKEKEILSGAYRKAQKIRGEADAKAIKIYADSYNQSPDFYEFMRSLRAYEKVLDPSTKIILSTDNEFLKYLK